jgi:RNA polymerase sigma-70 factor (ECF subfamily)
VDDRSAELVARWRDGDSRAAEQLFERYAGRLVALARSRLSEKLARRLDPEDIVQSAFRSFFDGLHQGQYDLPHRGDLWRLLVSITLHKVYRQARRHAAGKRDLDREQPLGDAPDRWPVPVQQLAEEPSPAETTALAEEVEVLLGGLSPVQREVAELRLQGHTQNEIAEVVRRSQRTVRRWLEEIKQHLEQRYAGDLQG